MEKETRSAQFDVRISGCFFVLYMFIFRVL